MRLGPLADLNELLHKLESVYGTVELKESLLAKFYSAHQKEDEDVSSWSCRLEDLLAHAINDGEVDFKKANNMLRTMFWTGLLPHLRDVSGHKYDSITDFDTLRVAIRQIEYTTRERVEMPSKRSLPSKMAHTSMESSECRELKGMIQKLTAEVASIKQQTEPSRQPSYHRRQNRGRKYGSESEGRSNTSDNDEPICFRCGQKGHVRLGCRVKLDHLRHNLNSRQPMGRGAP